MIHREFQSRGGRRHSEIPPFPVVAEHNARALSAPAPGGHGLVSKEHLQALVGSNVPIFTVMSHDACSVDPETSVEGLTTFLLESRQGAAPVINAAGALIGMVSVADLLREVQDRGDVEEWTSLPVPEEQRVQMELGDGFHGTTLARGTVKEIMTPSTVALPESTSVTQAAAFMSFEGVSHLPVACSRCKGVCVVSALDVMRWLARQDGFALAPPVAPLETH